MVSVSKNKEISHFVDELVRGGEWMLSSGSKHKYHLLHVKSKIQFPIPGSPSDNRAFLNFRASARRVVKYIELGIPLSIHGF